MNIDATRLSEQVHVYDREQLLRISLYYLIIQAHSLQDTLLVTD